MNLTARCGHISAAVAGKASAPKAITIAARIALATEVDAIATSRETIKKISRRSPILLS
jgi:hypothetical protein